MKMLAALSALLLASLACRPVITVGWGEMFFVFALVLILIGPPLFRLYRKIEKYRSQADKEQKKKG